MRTVNTIGLMMIIIIVSGMLLQCGSPADLFGNVEERVAEAQSSEESPLSPSGLIASTASESQIDLTWTDNSDNESEFQIQRDSGSGFQSIDSIGADSVAYSDTGLSSEHTYIYRVRAVNSAGESEWTNKVSATTNPPPLQPPIAPSELTAVTQSPDQVSLSWSDNSTTEESFVIQRKEGATGSYSTIASLPANTTGHDDSSLDSETEYYYQIQATNSAGGSAWDTSHTTTEELTAPADLTTTLITHERITLQWDEKSDYEEYVELDVNGSSIQLSVDTDTYTDFDLESNTSYQYRVRVGDAGGTSSWTDYFTVTTTYAPGDNFTFTVGSLDYFLKYVPGGTFPTGTWDIDRETVDPFWLNDTEITNELVAEVFQWAYDEGKLSEGTVDSTTVSLYGQELLDPDYQYGQVGFSNGTFSVEIGDGWYPCVNISWYGAILFCNWLTEMIDGTTNEIVYSGMDSDWIDDETIENRSNTGFRLPTGFEWECAARYIGMEAPSTGGVLDSEVITTESEGITYYWTPADYASGASDDTNNDTATGEVAWYSGNSGTEPNSDFWSGKGTHVIGTATAGSPNSVRTGNTNQVGIYDMSGNVSEWCFTTNSGLDRDCRGGNWDYDETELQVGERTVHSTGSYRAYGFRIARSVNE